MPEEEPKLQIDDDWKSEAAADKERLADSIEEGGDRQERIPKADFVALLQMIATSAPNLHHRKWFCPSHGSSVL